MKFKIFFGGFCISIGQPGHTNGQWSHTGLTPCLMDWEGGVSNREENLKGKVWKEEENGAEHPKWLAQQGNFYIDISPGAKT